MRYSIDLTKDAFDRIDFSEAVITDFYCQRKLPANLEFTIWGATLLQSPRWGHKGFDGLPNADDMYVSGEGIIRISNLLGGSMDVYVYDNLKNMDKTLTIAKNSDGSELCLKRSWAYERTENLNEYLWECVLAWPYGACILNLCSDGGNVTYEFDSDQLIPVNAYVMNPSLYTFMN